MRQMFTHRYGWVLAIIVLAIPLGLLLPLASRAHVVPEEPWHPVPAAYRRALFYANLKPINWELITREYDAPITEAGYDSRSAYELIEEAEKAGGP